MNTYFFYQPKKQNKLENEKDYMYLYFDAHRMTEPLPQVDLVLKLSAALEIILKLVNRVLVIVEKSCEWILMYLWRH